MNIRRPHHSAFTLVELLVVIGIIGVLVSILLPALARSREAANRVKCASNLRQIAATFHVYAAENRGFFPWMGPPGKNAIGHNWAAPDIWLWNKTNADYFVEKYLRFKYTDPKLPTPPPMLYCPSASSDVTDQIQVWWRGAYSQGGSGLIWRATGYSTFTSTALSATDEPGNAPYMNRMGLDGAVYPGNDKRSDMMARRNNDKGRRFLLSDIVKTGTDSQVVTFETSWFSNHWKGTQPAGGNFAYTDGSVVWRNFSDLKKAYWWDERTRHFW